jgi:hypothetical protein
MWAMTLGRGGWCSYQEGEDGPLYVVRFEEREGRLAVAEVHVQATGQMSEALHGLPLRQLEAMARGSTKLRRAIREAEDPAALTDEWLDAVAPERAPAWLSPRTPPSPGAVRPGVIYSLRIRGANEPGKRSEDFYRRVSDAHAYVTATRGGSAAQAIADANGVPLSTVYRWLKEARRRGLTSDEASKDAPKAGRPKPKEV